MTTKTPKTPKTSIRLGPGPGSAMDAALADLVFRLSGDVLVARSAAWVSRERGLGHVCVRLEEHAGAPVRGGEETWRWPGLEEWIDALRATPWVLSAEEASAENVPPASMAPLVLDGSGRLYLYRYFRAEERLAGRVLRIVLEAGGLETGPEIEALLAHLFDDGASGEPSSDPARAARTALRSPLTLVSGGPGTGKTTTVARILVLLLAADPELRIALAAPTGKAAARLGEAIREKLEELSGVDLGADLHDSLPEDLAGLLEQVPREAQTLHRLLGYSPSRDRFRHRADEPLSCDLLVVDEASMVDLLLMDSLLDALPPGARLILLGDRDQLASVEAGFVFGDLVRAAGLDAGLDDGLDAGLDDGIDDPSLAGTAVELRKNWRFAERPGIAELASAIRQGDLRRALEVLEDPDHPDVTRLDPPASLSAVVEHVAEEIVLQVEASDAEEALERSDAFRILCATRVGVRGVDQLNERVEDFLRRRGRIDPMAEEAWYDGRPILVQENQYRIGLFNGDLGVCRARDGRLWAFFPSLVAADGPRRIPLGKLPRHDTAWAMTVHKSQGSEVDRVLLVLPDDAEAASGILGRELLYTGVTRARRQVEIVSSVEVLGAALERTNRRGSGLVEALRRRAVLP